MTNPEGTAPSSSAASEGAKKDDDEGAWGAATDFDSLEKEASKIFAVWESGSGGDAPTPASDAPAEANGQATWSAAPAPSSLAAVAPAVVAPVAEVVAPEPASTAPVPVVAAAPAASARAVAPVAPKAAARPAPAALPDVPAAVPVRASQRPRAATPAAIPSAVRIENDDPVALPSTPPYGVIAAAAIAMIGLVGVSMWVLGGGTHAPPLTRAVAAAPTSVATEPAPPAAAPVSVVAIAPTTVAPTSVAAPPISAPVAVAPVAVAPVAAAPIAPVAVVPPPTPTHRLEVTVTPADATLTLDGAPVVSPLDRRIDEGSHQLVATRDGYVSETQAVDASRDRTVQIRLRAVPAPPPEHHDPVASAPPPPSAATSRLASSVGARPHPPAHPPRGPARRGTSTLVTESPY